MSRTFSGPRSRSIWANTVLSDASVASLIVIEQPHALPSAVVTSQGPYSGRLRLSTLDSYVVESGSTPWRIAVVST